MDHGRGLAPPVVHTSLHLSSRGNRPDTLHYPIAIGIVVVMQVDRRIDVTWDELDALANLQRQRCRLRAICPRENAMLITSWQVFYALQSLGFGHTAIDGQRLATTALVRAGWLMTVERMVNAFA